MHEVSSSPSSGSSHTIVADSDSSNHARHNPVTTSSSGLSFADVDRVEVKIRDIAVTIDNASSWRDPTTYWSFLQPKHKRPEATKAILHPVSADLGPGTLTAVLGGSGSGKTTLLDAVAERSQGPRLVRTGFATFNGHVGVHSIKHAYVTQQDILLPTITVRETLNYAAELRLPSSTSKADRRTIVEAVIHELGLWHCADTQIGTTRRRGCSGGEKRRVSIGVQLLANPSVLFLDEPTTGLDAASAFQLMHTLKSLARKGRTIITTIHQPRSEIWDLLDNLIVLTRGYAVYSGPVSRCLPWFEAQGFALIPFTNPADFIIDVTSLDCRSRSLEEKSRAQVASIRGAWLLESESRFPPLSRPSDATIGPSRVLKVGLLCQIRVLTHRTLKVTYRDPLGMTSSILEAVFMGLAAGYMFYNLGRDQAGIKSRQGCLYVAATLQGYLTLLFETYRMTLDIPTFDREALEGYVSPLAFILSRRIARFVTEDVPVPLIFSTLVYFMAGFDREASKFFIFFTITLLAHYIAITFAMLCVVLQRNFAAASLIANMMYTLQSLASGMIVQIDTLPVYVRWTRWITYTFYIFGAYISNEFQGSFFACPDPGGASKPACTQYTGAFVIKSLGFPPNWIGPPIGYMFAFIAVFCTLSLVGLVYLNNTTTISRRRDADIDSPATNVQGSMQCGIQMKPIAVGLEELALDVEIKSIFGKLKTTKPVLRPITGMFQAGILNVIIGSSGSGKTSLLNIISSRLRRSTTTSYVLSGKMAFNGLEPSSQVVQSVCSSVHQDDDSLLPTLTVRETLRYSAALRLPEFMSLDEKYRRAEEMLLKMGLKDCAHNLIGNELTKGISGGEKRRVSIAIQILTDPRVLLVDEPTSGLDAFTANSIVQVLKDLAGEGRTVIVAIHQARSDMFKQFGNVLHLAPGGHPVYFGPAKDMVGYFGSRGYECPTHTNPADFALDLVSSQSSGDIDGGNDSCERVQNLNSLWRESSQEKNEIHAQMRSQSSHPAIETDKADERCISSAHDDSSADNCTSETPSPDHARRSRRFPLTMLRPWKRTRVDMPAELCAFVRSRASFRASFPLLVRRSIINTRRQPHLAIARIMQSTGVALLFALFFAPLGHDFYSIQTGMGFFQQLGGFYIIGMLTNIAVYPNERDVFYKEHQDGIYGVDAFLATYTAIELPFEIINSFLFGLLATFAIGLPHTAPTYFVAVAACFTGLSCGESLGIIFNTLFSHTGFAFNLMGVILAVANAMAGILSINMPDLFRYLNYLSPIRYQTHGLAYYSLHDALFTCGEDQILGDGTCPITRGQQVLDLYEFNDGPFVNLLGMPACVITYRLLAWYVVHLSRRGR